MRLHRSVVPGLWNDILPRRETLPGPWKMTPLAHCAGSAGPGLKGTSIKGASPFTSTKGTDTSHHFPSADTRRLTSGHPSSSGSTAGRGLQLFPSPSGRTHTECPFSHSVPCALCSERTSFSSSCSLHLETSTKTHRLREIVLTACHLPLPPQTLK